jgi:group II intron reverse transcriptase/maturase
MEAVRTAAMQYKTGTVVEMDISKFFDTINRAQLMEFLRLRIRDGVLLRLIGKWLNAGVMEDGAVTFPDAGTPQGGVISPILANVYLHYVLDLWFEHEVKPCLRGRATLVRYADDAVIVCELAYDAQRLMAVLPKRFERYGLKLHPTKTRLVPFHRPGRRLRKDVPPNTGPGSFDFMGFTFYWGVSRKGNDVVFHKTAKDRLARSVRRVREWCRTHLHQPLTEQYKTLRKMIRGHYNYYGVTGNTRSLGLFYRHAQLAWQYWLARRSRKANATFAWFNALLRRMPLPPPRIVHSAMA